MARTYCIIVSLPTSNDENTEGLYEQLPGESGLSPGDEDTPGMYAPLYANGRDPDELKRLHHPHLVTAPSAAGTPATVGVATSHNTDNGMKPLVLL